MNEHVYEKLQYNTLKEIVKEYCVSKLGKSLIENLNPSGNKGIVCNRLLETTEARALLDYSGSVPIQGIVGIDDLVDKVEKDIILDGEQLTHFALFLRGCRKMKQYMRDKEGYAPTLQGYSMSLIEYRNIEEEIDQCIRNNRVCDEASKELKKIRRHISITEGKIEERLDKFLKNSQNKLYIQDFFVTKRQGRLTVPIKVAYKNVVPGVIVESTAKTVFMEPSTVGKYTEELLTLQADEAVEEYKILTYLTGLIYEHMEGLKLNVEVMGQFDMAFAKGKYSKAIEGRSPKVNDYGYINIVEGRHPLLPGKVVPLNFKMGKDFRSLIITGPNAGGKTIVLKTVGLLTLAMQSGFHIPVGEGTSLSVFDKVFADIGDDQSLENSLSTFSSHVKNLAGIIRETNKSTLLLFDEIGSGTEPGEGAALAIAILEEVYQRGAITVATTHYNEIKNFSEQHPDFKNAAMQFNSETLEPLYKLVIDKVGESNALWISRKMGIEEGILKKAAKYMEDKHYNLDYVSSNKVRMGKQEVAKVKAKEVLWSKGDKVYLTNKEDYAIVYSEKDKYNNLTVFYKNELIEVNEKQVTLSIRAEELYPAGYDLDSLFTSYKDRKLEHDIERGSKKTLKKIRKYGIEELRK